MDASFIIIPFASDRKIKLEDINIGIGAHKALTANSQVGIPVLIKSLYDRIRCFRLPSILI